MLSYRHAFHAGNYADLVKHCCLVAMVRHLTQKAGPLLYLDTHAGAGLYRLDSDQALKTGEASAAIGQLWQSADLPPLLADYRQLIRSLNPNGRLLRYPGSPWLAAHCLRPQDSLALCELHSTDGPLLSKNFAKDKRVRCFQADGYRQSLALMPPASRRGLVLIDPSYEVKSEYEQVVKHLQQLYKRFATGSYAVWYPVVEAGRTEDMVRKLVNSGIRRIHRYELGLTHNHQQAGMTASGMLVINPPWTLRNQMAETLAWLVATLYPSGYWLADELVGE